VVARYSYTPLFGYNRGVRGPKPPARIIGWDVNDVSGARLVTVSARSEARAIVSRLNNQAKVIRNTRRSLEQAVRVAERIASRGVL
jgi:hypothetical protein